MKLKELLDQVDTDAVARYWTEYFFHENYYPKPEASAGELTERLSSRKSPV